MDQDTGKPTGSETQGETDQPKPLPSGSLKPIEPAAETPDGSHGNNQSHEKKKSLWPARIEATCAVLLVIITGFYTWFAKKQATASLKAANAAEVGANAARSAATTADQTLKDAESEFRISQRPYIWAHARPVDSSGRIVHGSPERITIDIGVDIVNFGKSPAINTISTQSFIRAGPKSEIEKWVKTFTPKYPSVNGDIMIPNAPVTVVTGKIDPLTGDQVKLVISGDWEVFVVGAVKYTDIFQPQIPPYETVYCFQYLPTGMPIGNCELRLSIK